MSTRVLVTYATRGESTASVAIAIGRILAADGIRVDVLPVGVIKSVEIYSAVIVGSGVHNGVWLPEATDFVEEHAPAMQQKPLAVFTVCMMAVDDSLENQPEIESYTEPLLSVVKPFSVGCFAGRLDLSERNLLKRARVTIKGLPRGDHRDWPSIHQWTLGLETVIAPVAI